MRSLGILTYIYIDKNIKTINSIDFVNLKSEILLQDENMFFPLMKNYRIPFFNTSNWDSVSNDDWQIIYNEEAVEVYHNGIDYIHISYGKKNTMLPINEGILFDFDVNDILTGFHIKDEVEVPKLLELLVNPNLSNTQN